MNDVANRLNAAADLIEVEGWEMGPAAMCNSGPVCLEGALSRVGVERDSTSMYPKKDTPEYQAVVRYLGDELKYRHYRSMELWRWNDMVAGSGERVVAVLRGAALMVEAEQTEKVTA